MEAPSGERRRGPWISARTEKVQRSVKRTLAGWLAGLFLSLLPRRRFRLTQGTPTQSQERSLQWLVCEFPDDARVFTKSELGAVGKRQWNDLKASYR